MTTTRLLLSAGLLAAGLTACGGDPAQAPPAPLVEVPISAADSPSAYVTFVQAQAASGSETGEPLSLDSFALAPTTEADEPVALN